MPLVVHCLLELLLSLIEFRQTAAGPSLPLQVRSNRDEPPFEESLSDSEDSVRSSTVKSTTTDTESNSYYTRLDFISVVVICAVCALCFGVCVVLGCRKKKRHMSSHGPTGSSSSPPSFTDSRSEPRITNLINFPSELRIIPETPPPTYSIIERQTSFTSYVSQTSSQWEIPPNYDEAVSLGKAAAATGGGEPFANQIGCKASTTARSDRSAGLRLLPTRGASTVAARSKRSESARTYCPPRARRFYHSSSDVGRMHRTRLLSRPATVSEDDSPPIVNTTSCAAVTEDSPSGRNTAQHAQLNTSQTFGVSTEVFPHAWHAHCSTAERYPKTNLFNSHT